MGCYVKSQGYGDETYGVFDAKEINKNLTTCTCSSLSFDEEQFLYKFYETKKCIFLFELQTHTHKN